MFLNFKNREKFEQKLFVSLILDDFDYMYSFGYGSDLESIANYIRPVHDQIKLFVTVTNEIDEELKRIKLQFLPKSVNIKVKFDEEQQD